MQGSRPMHPQLAARLAGGDCGLALVIDCLSASSHCIVAGGRAVAVL